MNLCFDDIPAILRNKIVQEQTPFTNFMQLFETDYWGTPIYKVSSEIYFLFFLFCCKLWIKILKSANYTNDELHFQLGSSFLCICKMNKIKVKLKKKTFTFRDSYSKSD